MWRSLNAKLEVDRALDIANKTLHRLQKEVPLECEAVTKAAELNCTRDKQVYPEVHVSEADAKNISGKWVLKSHKARYVLRGFEEDVKDVDVFHQHDDDSIRENATLPSNRRQKRWLHSVHGRRENRFSHLTHE